MFKKRKEIKFYKLVGKIDDEFYCLDYVFKHGKDFKGATGTKFVAIPKREYEEKTDFDYIMGYIKEFWKEDKNTELSLKEYTEDWIDSTWDKAEIVFDLSYSEGWDQIRKAEPELTEEEYPIFDCIGGGRCFVKNMKFDKIYDKKLYALINKYES